LEKSQPEKSLADNETDLIVRGTSNVRHAVERIVGKSNVEEVLQHTAEQVIGIVRKSKDGRDPIRNIAALTGHVAIKRAIDFRRKQSRAIISDIISTNRYSTDPWTLVDTLLDLESAIPRISKDAGKIVEKVLNAYGKNVTRKEYVMDKSIVVESSLLYNHKVAALIGIGGVDMLTTWMSDGERHVVMVDKFINVCSIPDFEDDLKHLAKMGGYGHVDIVTPSGICFRYSLSAEGVNKKECKFKDPNSEVVIKAGTEEPGLFDEIWAGKTQPNK
jgi:hypothetical protein